MCYNINFYKPEFWNESTRKIFADIDAKFLNGLYHVSGFQFPKYPVITFENRDKLTYAEWGFLPPWIDSEEKVSEWRKKFTTLNCRSEEADTKKTFHNALKNYQLCLIPVTGFFEYHKMTSEDFKKIIYQDGLPEKPGKSYPYFIYKKDNLFFLAGIYEKNRIKTESGNIKEEITFAVLTSGANELMSFIHNSKKRMPVILPAKEEFSFFDNPEYNYLKKNFFLPSNEKLLARTVSTDVVNPRAFSNRKDITNTVKYMHLPIFEVNSE